MSEIQLGVKGKILNTNEQIMIEDDTKGKTGGYYIYIWPQKRKSNEMEVYDSWFESLDKVKQQIKYEGWKIKWASSS